MTSPTGSFDAGPPGTGDVERPAADPVAANLLDAAAIERLATELFRQGGWTVEAPAALAVPMAPVSAPSAQSPDVPVPTAPSSGPALQSPDVTLPAAPISAPPVESPDVPLPVAPVSAPAFVSPFSGAEAVVPPAPEVPVSAPSASPRTGYYFIDEAIAWTPAAEGPEVLSPPDAPVSAAAPEVTPNSGPSAKLPAESLESDPAVVPTLEPVSGPLDVAAVRREFPILSERVHGRRLVWLDSGATSQTPAQVIDRVSYYYEHENSNVHRGAHTLAERSTAAYETARDKVAAFVNAPSSDAIVWVRGATEGINLVAAAWGGSHVKDGDEILVSQLEHHANIVPWQLLARDTGARLVVIPADDTGQLRLDEYDRLLSHRTRIVAVTAVSNAIGTVTPLRALIASAHRYGAHVLVDAAQAVPHLRVDVQDLDADFLVFSGHKMYGPMGIGVVYGKPELLADMPPWQGGGNMIADVTFERTAYQAPPARFEAGTGSIADAVGLGAAVDWMERIGVENIARHEHVLIEYALEELARVPGLRFIGAPAERAGVISFALDGHRADDIGKALDGYGIAVRAGHHCAQPILRRLGVESSVRPSFAVHNDRDDVDELVSALCDITARKGL